MSPMKVVFMGTPDFAVPTLEALLETQDVVAVYSQPPRPAGRGHREQLSPVHKLAEARGIPVHTPKSLKREDAQRTFAAHTADIAVVAAYGLILPPPVLSAPRLGCVNVHASLLPRWRGAAPIQRAILAGDTETGVCLMKMEAGLDTGPVFTCRRVPIDARTTAGALHDRLAALGGDMIRENLPAIESGALVPEPQSKDGVTYAAKIERAETRIVWREPADAVVRQINGFAPVPGAWSEAGGARLKILGAHVDSGRGEAGMVLDDALLVACGSGAIRIDTIQEAGRKPLAAKEFLRGHAVAAGTVFV